MAQVVRFSRAVSTTVVNDIKAALDAGAGAATIKLYTGTMPATPETGITSQVLLGTCTCTDPVGTESGGTLTFSAITQDSSADNSGTATWARFATSAGTAIFDGDVGVTGSGAFLEMVTTTVAAGAPLAITSGTLRLP
jgi:hypothetical protein